MSQSIEKKLRLYVNSIISYFDKILQVRQNPYGYHAMKELSTIKGCLHSLSDRFCVITIDIIIFDGN